jgi:DNA polymerase I
MQKKKVLLIDGDILLYKIALNNEVDTHWGDGLWTLHCDEKHL